MEIIPAILANKKEDFLEKVQQIEPYVERFHLDIADGIFVPSLTIIVDDVEGIETPLKFAVHLMVQNPENHIGRWLETSADTFIFHAEATHKPQEFIDAAKEKDGSVGVALNPETPIQVIQDYVDTVDFVQFMTVKPGFYGSPFLPEVLEKIKEFHYFYPDKPIVADGGVTPETAPQLVEAGASILVSGSYIFKNQNIAKALEDFKAL